MSRFAFFLGSETQVIGMVYVLARIGFQGIDFGKHLSIVLFRPCVAQC